MESSLNMHFFIYSRTTVLKRMHMSCAVEIHPQNITWTTWIGKFDHNFCDEHEYVQKNQLSLKIAVSTWTMLTKRTLWLFSIQFLGEHEMNKKQFFTSWLTKLNSYINKCHSLVGSTPSSHLRGTKFKPWSGDQVVLLSSSTANAWILQFRPRSLPSRSFLIHYSLINLSSDAL
jgi:hypothetical protein